MTPLWKRATQKDFCILGEFGIKLTELGRFSEKNRVGLLGIVGLNFDDLFERLDAWQFFSKVAAPVSKLLLV